MWDGMMSSGLGTFFLPRRDLVFSSAFFIKRSIPFTLVLVTFFVQNWVLEKKIFPPPAIKSNGRSLRSSLILRVGVYYFLAVLRGNDGNDIL